MKTIPILSRFSRVFTWLIVGICAILIIAFISWLTVPSYLKKTLEEQVEAHTGRHLTVGEVVFNPLTLTIDLSHLVLYEADRKSPAFSADNLELKASLASLVHFAPVLREVILTHPIIHLVRQQQEGKNATNFNDVFKRLSEHPHQGNPLQYSISNIQLSNGEIDLEDHITKKNIQIKSLTIGLPFLSNFSSATDVFIEPSLSAQVNGSLFELKGRSKPFLDSHETSLAINLNRLDITQIIAFLPNALLFKVNKAKFSSKLVLNYFTFKNEPHVVLLGTVSLSDVATTDLEDAPLFKAKSINATLREVNVITQNVTLQSIEINEPQFWASLDKHGVLNWLPLHTKKETSGESEKADSHPQKPLFALSHLQLKNGTVYWSDSANATPAMKTKFTDLNISADNISTGDKASLGKIKVDLGAKGKQQAHFTGIVDLAHAVTSGELILSNVNLSEFQPYISQTIAANMSGNMSLKTRLLVQNGNVDLSEFSSTINELKVKADKSDFGGMSARKIAIINLSMRSELQQAKIEKLVFDHVQGDVFRNAGGKLNLSYLLKNSTNHSNEHNKKSLNEKNSNAKIAKRLSWQTEIGQISLTDSNFIFSDKSKNPAVKIQADGVKVELKQVSTKFDQPVKIMASATVNKTGKISLDGSVSEKNMQLNVDLQNFSVTALQPYFTDFLNITVSKGAVSTKGKLNWIAPMQMSYQGNLTLANFAASEKEYSKDFLRWKMMGIDTVSVNLGTKPQNITLGNINLSDFYTRLVLSEQGKLNLQKILVHQQENNVGNNAETVPGNGQSSEQNKQQNNDQNKLVPPIIKIAKINFNNGIINYTDNFIKPHYSMRMTGMSGSVGMIQSSMAQSAPIDLVGKIDNDAPIAISGSLNPLFTPILLNIKMTANGIDLPRLTAYSAKYAGYPIEKGKLSMVVEYHIQDNQLTATNSLKLDQLTFGNKVDSPDAVHLPIPLVVSLLADSNGQINLDLPIAGSINDPQFSVGGLVFRALMNILGKVLTSPFALLSHSFSHADELAYIEFPSGSTEISDASKEKLDNLAKALEQRPKLTLDIIGRADLVADTPGLCQRKLSWQIKKITEQQKEDADDDSPDNSTNKPISEADRAKAIEKIYSAAKFDKPHNKLGFNKSLTTTEKENLILANTQIDEDDLQALAVRREVTVRRYLEETEHVSPERLYSIAPKINGSDIKDKGAVSRVDFDLKM